MSLVQRLGKIYTFSQLQIKMSDIFLIETSLSLEAYPNETKNAVPDVPLLKS